METPTIVKQTKDYLLIKVPLPKRDNVLDHLQKDVKMTAAEKRLWKIIQEGKRDTREGRVITAKSIDKALRRYDKHQWD